jgi:pSer/pThr/pTyr-binding forkhead associated (FHA) protein
MSERKLSMVVRYPGKRKPLIFEPGDQLKIGRHTSNDIVFRDGTVSRFHACMVWDRDEDRPYITDNESANGVEVDGKLIDQRAYLRGNNEVTIGDFVISLELEKSEEEDETQRFLIEDEGDAVVLFTDTGREIRGVANDNTSLQELFLTLESKERTGTLSVEIAGSRATILYSLGHIVGCTYQDQTAEEALYSVLEKNGGIYHFSPMVTPGVSDLDVSVKQFIMQEFGAEGTGRISMTRAVKRPPKEGQGEDEDQYDDESE